jgi:Putative lumazine-binding
LDNRTSSPVRSSNVTTPRLLSISLLDDRTSLVKLIGSDGAKRYLNLLRFDPDLRNSVKVSNDGWLILREIVVPSETTKKASKDSFGSLNQTIQTYLDVEHGGGPISRAKAEDIFSPNASLIAVGNLPQDEVPTQWTAPSGSLLEIPLSTYLEGVETQHPHSSTCRTHDAVLSLDVSGFAAVATVRVGNGAQIQLFDDILLFGKKDDNDDESSGGWRILSKIFSTKSWPT